MQSKRFAVLGDPVDHSLSPAMHQAAFRAAGISATYEAIRVPRARLPEELARLRDDGFVGVNLTVPLKETAAPLMSSLSDRAREVGAVNTVTFRDGQMVGDNTDTEGFLASVDDFLSRLRPGPAVIVGAGGAALAVLTGLQRVGLDLVVVNRTESRARILLNRFERVEFVPLADPATVARKVTAAAIVVNATSVGLHAGDPSPLPPGMQFHSATVVVDLIYSRRTRLLQDAAEAGCRYRDGLEMLVRQGAEAFFLWTGVRPNVDVMRRACRTRLEENVCCAS
jgi:shikimate dehydrogenase